MPQISESLLLKNIVLGLTFTTHGFPSSFAEAGYTFIVLEESVKTLSFAVSFDGIVAAPMLNRSLLIEMKGGAYAEVEEQNRFLAQVGKYPKLQVTDVAGIVPIRPPHQPLHHEHDVVVLTIGARSSHVIHLLQQATHKPPVLSARLSQAALDDLPLYNGMSVAHGSLKDKALEQKLLEPTLSSQIPLLIGFEPGDDARIILEQLAPTLVERLVPAQTDTRFSTEDLLRDVIRGWEFLSSGEKGQYISRVRRLLQQHIAASGLNNILKWDARSSTWVFTATYKMSIKDRQAFFLKEIRQLLQKAKRPSLLDNDVGGEQLELE